MDYKHYHRDETYRKLESHFRNIFMTRFVIAKRYTKPMHRVLEIGASAGVMLDIFKEDGCETWGVEPSESGISAKNKGHKIINSYFEKAKLPLNYFDLVIANHTLEHVDDPLAVLEKANKVLKKDGTILIDVPNAGGLGSRILGDKWPYRLPEEHKSQFTRKSLSKLFGEAGFEVVYFKSRSGIFEFANPILELWQSLIGLKKRFFFNVLTFPYALVATVFNMGDSMTLVGRKK